MLRVRFTALTLILLMGCNVLPGLSWSSLPTTRLSLNGSAEQQAAFASAYEALRRHNDRVAYGLFAGLVSAYPGLADHHLYFAGVAAQHLSSPRDAAKHFAEILRRYPRSIHAAPAALELARIELKDGRWQAARAHLYQALNDAKDSDVKHAAQLALGEAEERAGDVQAAHRQLMALRNDAPAPSLARSARERVEALRKSHPELLPSGRDRFDEARLLINEQEFAAAEALTATLIENPGPLDRAEILRLQADAEYGAGKLEPAMKTYWSIAENYPSSPQAPAALFRMAGALWNRDRDLAALRLFEDYLRRYPGHDKNAEALYASARIEQQSGRDDQAIQHYGELARRFPQDKLAAEASWRVGWIDFQRRRYAAAADSFGRISNGGGESRYWQARALEAAGNQRSAHALYERTAAEEPQSYYGMLARQRLEGSGRSSLQLTGTAPAEAPAIAEPAPPFADDFHVSRWKELKGAKVYDLARRELLAIEREHGNDPAAQQFLIDAYRTVDGYGAAIRLAKSNPGLTRSNEEKQQLNYPLAFWTSTRRAAEAQAVNPFLVVSIMRQESLFDPKAHSSADARGLLQLLPSTAQRVAPTVPGLVDPTDLYDPDTNINLGTRYMRTLLDRFNDPFKAIAAYNGGENAVEKWMRQNPGAEPDVFVENITYRETRDYVKRVIAAYAQYASLYRR